MTVVGAAPVGVRGALRSAPRIGVFGGSFDPPHVGHLLAASDAADQLGLDRLLFVPTATQPLKAEGRAASPATRVATPRRRCSRYWIQSRTMLLLTTTSQLGATCPRYQHLTCCTLVHGKPVAYCMMSATHVMSS